MNRGGAFSLNSGYSLRYGSFTAGTATLLVMHRDGFDRNTVGERECHLDLVQQVDVNEVALRRHNQNTLLCEVQPHEQYVPYVTEH